MYFENFPKITYSFKISDNKPDETMVVKDITQNVRFRKEVFERVKFYDTYKIQDGDTPEIISEKIYGNPQYHWIIMLVNERYNYIDDFAKDAFVVEETIQQKYGQYRYRAHHFLDSNGQVVNGNCTIQIAKPVIGSIRTVENEIQVYGTNTNFTKDIHVGNKLYTSTNILLGTVATIVNDELINLQEICPISYDDGYRCELPIETGMVISKSTPIGYITGYVNSVSGSYVGLTLTNSSFAPDDGVTVYRYGEDSERNFTQTIIGTANIISVDYPVDINMVNYQDNEYRINELNRELKIIPKADIDQILSEFTDLI